MGARDQWTSRAGFVMATVGAAVGMGNLWRFPYQAFANGGGAFLIPYGVALLTAGVPLMILEFGLGQRMRAAAPLAFAKLDRRWEWLGWWAVMIPLLVMCFYSTVIAWSLNYLVYALTQAWGPDPGEFFAARFLGLTTGPFVWGGVRLHILAAVALVWLTNFLIVRRGICGGIERVCRIVTPLLAVLMVLMTIRGVTLPGSGHGLSWFLRPDFSRIADPGVWIAAYGQVFFSTTLAVGVMIAYASYLPRRADVVGSASLTVLSNAGFDVLAGLCVFSTLGFAAVQSSLPLEESVASGPGVAFVAFPHAISMLPMSAALRAAFGVVFFFCLIIAGISSSISMLEAFASAALDKYPRVGRTRLVGGLCVFGLAGSVVYAGGNGVHLLQIVDHFVNQYGIVVIGLIEVIVVGYLYNAAVMRAQINANATVRIGVWWEWLIRYVTPLLLGTMLVRNLAAEVTQRYEGYPLSALVLFGWSVAAGILIAGLLLARRPWSDPSVVSADEPRPGRALADGRR